MIVLHVQMKVIVKLILLLMNVVQVQDLVMRIVLLVTGIKIVVLMRMAVVEQIIVTHMVIQMMEPIHIVGLLDAKIMMTL
jgi:hypothetical protein